ncbi:MAG: DUF302 domain-containing protein [Flavobacteriaceae bacterium]|jgi:uncharacterized protein (DUF302 family)|nr:DUF302 domain-containing protein [Flavobacteriaceae bacterium]NVJ72796.1 DUF302 domain-containing protein [Flavobacteriaceae bacterium]
MNYHKSVTQEGKSFEEVIEAVTEALKTEGFGVLTDIDVSATFKKKLDLDFQKYRILGACNPHFAHKAISSENKIGVFLPCNVVVQQHEDGSIEVSAVDPMASMMSVENEELGALASEVNAKLDKVIAQLS